MKKKVFSFMVFMFCFSFVVYAEPNDEELVLLDLPKEGVHFPIGIDDIFGEKTKRFYYNETGTELLNKGFLKDSYYIGKYEVTYKLWKKVHDWATTGAGKNKGYVFNKGKMGYAGSGKDFKTKLPVKVNLTEKHPVTNVNWYDCIVWCNAYSEMCGAVPVYYKKEILDKDGKVKAENLKNVQKFILRNAKTEKKDCNTLIWLTAKDLQIKNKENGFRLPSWLEWQLAAKLTDKKDYIVEKNGKALQCTVNGKQWFFTKGDTVSGGKYATADIGRMEDDFKVKDCRKYANFGHVMFLSSPNPYHTIEAGSLLPNSLGIYDMSGNTDEWCLNYVPKHRTSLGDLVLAGRVAAGGDCTIPFNCMAFGQQSSSITTMRSRKNASARGLRICRTK